MTALLDRFGTTQRRIGLAGVVVIAAISLVPAGGHGAARPATRIPVPPGFVATVVTVDSSAASLVHGGDRIELVDPGQADAFGAPGTPRVIAQVMVLSVSASDGLTRQTRPLVVAADNASAVRLASTQGHRVLAVISLQP